MVKVVDVKKPIFSPFHDSVGNNNYGNTIAYLSLKNENCYRADDKGECVKKTKNYIFLINEVSSLNSRNT